MYNQVYIGEVEQALLQGECRCQVVLDPGTVYPKRIITFGQVVDTKGAITIRIDISDRFQLAIHQKHREVGQRIARSGGFIGTLAQQSANKANSARIGPANGRDVGCERVAIGGSGEGNQH